MRKLLVFACLIVPAAPAAAEAIFPRGATCEHVLTVQYATCRVKTYFRCGEDGQQIRAEELRPGKPRKATIYTPDLALIAVGDEAGMISMKPVPGTTVPLELSAVLAGTPQSYTMDIEMGMFGMTRSGPYVAEVRLLPEPLIIGTIELKRLEERADWTLPQPVGTISGIQMHYYSEDIGFPFLGEGSADLQGGKVVNDIYPIEIFFPGQPGFEDEQPKFDCQDLSSLASPRDAIRT